MQTQGLTAKKSNLKQFKPKEWKPANRSFFTLPITDKPAKPIRQEKKKKYQKNMRPEKVYFNSKK